MRFISYGSLPYAGWTINSFSLRELVRQQAGYRSFRFDDSTDKRLKSSFQERVTLTRVLFQSLRVGNSYVPAPVVDIPVSLQNQRGLSDTSAACAEH